MKHIIIAYFMGWITGPMICLYGFGFIVHNRLSGRPQTIWRYAYGTPFAVLNFVYNLVVGSIVWLELPRELQYTARVQRKADEGHELAKRQAWTLNYFDPGHVKVRGLL